MKGTEKLEEIVHIRLAPSQLRMIIEVADQTGWSTSDVVRTCIDATLDKANRPATVMAREMRKALRGGE